MTGVQWLSLIVGCAAAAFLVAAVVLGLWLVAAAMTLTLIGQVILFVDQRRRRTGDRT